MSRDDSSVKIPPYLVFFGTLLLLAPVHLLVPVASVVPVPYTLAGVVVLGVGLVFAIGQQRAVGRRGQRGLYTDVPDELITSGAFRFTRNPLYLGMVLLTLGIAVLLGSAGALLLVAVEVTIMHFWGIPYEERVLATAFGEEYEAYRRRVRRWL